MSRSCTSHSSALLLTLVLSLLGLSASHVVAQTPSSTLGRVRVTSAPAAPITLHASLQRQPVASYRAAGMQLVRIQLPGDGRITWFDSFGSNPTEMKTPGMARLSVGHTYRVRIDRLPDFPGIELYPTIQVIDHLHPPTGQDLQFPAAIAFTREDIETVLTGRMITWIVFLERPEFAVPMEIRDRLRIQTVHPGENAMRMAAELGRPLLLIRLGSRMPSVGESDASFFGRCGPIQPIADAGESSGRVPTEAEINELADRYPDEYVIDGGDRGLPIHYGRFHTFGVETEDTIAEYTDHTGHQQVKPTNRVAIYSPRFAAFRVLNSATTGVKVAKLDAVDDLTRGVDLRSRTALTHHDQRESAERVRMRSRSSGVQETQARQDLEQATTFAGHIKLSKLHEAERFTHGHEVSDTTAAISGEAVQAAVIWTRDQYPIVTASISGSQDLHAVFRPNELVASDESHKTPGRLQIVKMADKRVALSGDEIEFTIRYENLGDRELSDIRIIDNLTPRLQYVEDSATSDRPGQIIMNDNEEGSLLLRFELDDPLPGHAAGQVTFKARVR